MKFTRESEMEFTRESDMDFTDEQLDAIRSSGKNIVVSASAGAGKTRVLTERFKHKVLDSEPRTSIERIVALTFTKAAAQKMKNGVSQKLNECLNNSNYKDKKEYIEQQLVLLNRCEITTIDAFCLSIIKRYYPTIGLNPALCNNTLDEGLQKMYQHQAFRLALKELSQTHEKDLLDIFLILEPSPSKFDSIEEIIYEMIKVAKASNHKEQWFEEASKCYSSRSAIGKNDEKLKEAYFSYLDLQYNKIVEDVENMIMLMRENDQTDDNLKNLEGLNNRIKGLCKKKLEDREYDSFKEQFIQCIDSFRIDTNKDNDGFNAIRKTFNDDCNETLKNLYDLSVFNNDQKDLEGIAKTLVELAKRTDWHYTQIKQEHACMDFDDMEEYAYEILVANNYEISNLLKNMYDEIMVDEFQDTSYLQNEIIKLVANEGAIFRVGDVKQSIYRFRGAKPDLMRDLMKEPNNKVIVFKNNFRSKNNIVDFNNELFKKLMNVEMCKDTYTENDCVSIGPKKKNQKLCDKMPVQFILIKPNPNENKSDAKKGNLQLKAEWIANKIITLHGTTRPKTEYDKEENIEPGTYQLSDFAVLVNSNSDKLTIKYVFDQAGIPCSVDTRSGFFNSRLAQTLHCFLEYMLDPSNLIAFLTILTSPMYKVTEEELASIKIENKNPKDFKDTLFKTYDYVNEDLKRFAEIANDEGLYSMIKAIANHNDFYAQLDSHEQANFDFFLEKVLNVQDEVVSIMDLLSFMDQSKDEKSSEAISTGKDDDAVTITTIHQSKGLEYEIVFLISSEKNQNMDNKSKVYVDEELYLGLNHIDPFYRTVRTTPRRLAIAHKNNVESLEEFTRLLYVAATRPEDQLYIVDTMNLKKDMNGIKDMTVDKITLSMLDRRKGFSGLIRRVKFPENESYLKIEPVYAENLKHFDAQTHQKQDVINYENLSKKLKESSFITSHTIFNEPIETPSTLESQNGVTQLGNLKPSSIDGRRHGTKIHEAIASLPNTTWTMDQILETGVSLDDAKAIEAFGNSEFYQKALLGTIKKEFPYYIEKGQWRMDGTIDFISFFDDKILLLDFKTDAKEQGELIDSYTPQLEAYQKALQILYPDLPVEGYLYSFHLGKIIPLF